MGLENRRNMGFRYSSQGWRAFPDGSVVKNLPANAGDAGSVSGSERSHGVGNGNPFQYSCLENLMDRGAWRATAHRVAERVGHDLATKQFIVALDHHY